MRQSQTERERETETETFEEKHTKRTERKARHRYRLDSGNPFNKYFTLVKLHS